MPPDADLSYDAQRSLSLGYSHYCLIYDRGDSRLAGSSIVRFLTLVMACLSSFPFMPTFLPVFLLFLYYNSGVCFFLLLDTRWSLVFWCLFAGSVAIDQPIGR